MTEVRRHINLWWLAGLLAVLLTACSSSDDTAVIATDPASDPVLTFYVYAPERPMVTRAADDVAAADAENAINSLQIWVFETGTNNLVGYLNPDTYPTDAEGTKYLMTVSKAFANAATKPNVDVYVVANAAAAGLSMLNETTTRDDLEEAKIGSEYFGVGAPVSRITDKGLPMSGVLRNQTISGSNPVLSIGDGITMAKVNLLRTVSKMRYVFSRKVATADVYITSISLDGNMMPVEEYVFLQEGRSYHIGSSYEALTATLHWKNTEVKTCDAPDVYLYTNQTSQDYENLIDGGVSDEKLTQVGPFYFKETDRKISGTITYRVGSSSAQTVPFYMTVDDVSKRFVRNHSWIVYAYFNGAAEKPIITVWVDTNWQTGEHFTIEN
ncbi:MAG: hypothetical protein IJ533_03545 [Prevotella sp.]|nr:hypothetical protein [Prevotella sp.]